MLTAGSKSARSSFSVGVSCWGRRAGLSSSAEMRCCLRVCCRDEDDLDLAEEEGLYVEREGRRYSGVEGVMITVGSVGVVGDIRMAGLVVAQRSCLVVMYVLPVWCKVGERFVNGVAARAAYEGVIDAPGVPVGERRVGGGEIIGEDLDAKEEQSYRDLLSPRLLYCLLTQYASGAHSPVNTCLPEAGCSQLKANAIEDTRVNRERAGNKREHLSC
jgi:hypothetical protein